ncbi:hypothetical protein [Geosporobacter ferrireducens]|uniref:Uncharacterized protein n=1 Tax=Geosporobacter ferrireducens TaxID=1424294 RepID=A0A1D8GDV0_9FIRM|nr:hypothetical protein [Geosporobacter ferrireducens]AOT69088.1 hypothetical protein Gferi_05660 [Geosporobacter ferrireducens]MTI56761.1 hypothetical protein [Geosporobacter ferrireducens]
MYCPNCTNGKLILKDEVTYVYQYDIQDNGEVKWKDAEGYTSYLFFDREQKDFKQYVQCSKCETIYLHIVESREDMDMIILKKAIHSRGPVSNDFFI